MFRANGAFHSARCPRQDWRDRLLELAIADPVAAALDIEVEGALSSS